MMNMSCGADLACLAQRPERRTCNAMVIGSTPIAGYGLEKIDLACYSIVLTTMHTDCK